MTGADCRGSILPQIGELHPPKNGALDTPSVAKKIIPLLAAVAPATLGMYLVARGLRAESIMLEGGGGCALVVAMACVYFAAVDPWKDRG